MNKKQHGVALVEFALVLPLLLLLSFTVTEYGRALYQYNTLTKSVRDAARYLSTQNPGTKITEAKNLVVYGTLKPDNNSRPLALGLSTTQVPDPVWALAGSNPVINTVTVRIGDGIKGSSASYTFVPLFASAFGVDFGNITFAPISATMRGAL